MLTRVVNLDRNERRIFSLQPREAAMTAYAQSLGDWDFWGYEHTYGDSVISTTNGYVCGPFFALERTVPDPVKPTRPSFRRPSEMADADWSILKRMLEVLTLDELKQFAVMMSTYGDSVETIQEIVEHAVRRYRTDELRYEAFEKKHGR